MSPRVRRGGLHDISYRRTGDVGVLRFDFYNGAMSTGQCRRLARAIEHAARQDTRVLVVGGGEVFSNGIHLNVIEAAPQPALEAWRNINAIDDVCRGIITCSGQLVVSAVSGNAGAGGVMLALGADQVILREVVVLNPHYGTMGLFGSEYWTYVLPRRVGRFTAQSLTDACLPIGPAEALRVGLADAVLPGSPADFAEAVLAEATHLAAPARLRAAARRQTTLAHRRRVPPPRGVPRPGAGRDEPRHLRRPPRLRRRPPRLRHEAAPPSPTGHGGTLSRYAQSCLLARAAPSARARNFGQTTVGCTSGE